MKPALKNNPNLTLGSLRQRGLLGGIAIGVVCLLLALVAGWMENDGWRRLGFAYLVSFTFIVSAPLAALFFVAIQHLTRAGWSVVLRRLAEIMAASFVPLSVLALPILVALLLGSDAIFSWNSAELVEHDAVIRGKAAYLNGPFFVIRAVIYFTIWGVASTWFLRRSVLQDTTHDDNLTLKMQSASPIVLLLFALSVTFFAFDWLMSLDPHWYSTIYGIYYFAGAVVAFFSLLIVLAALLQYTGRLKSEISVDHFHDLGKLLFGFVFFWGYIAFSQYLLIWYANIPEETIWYLRRQENGWQWVSLSLVFFNLLLPFLALMSRSARRNLPWLAGWSVFLLLMHFVDLYWLAMPQLSATPVFGLVELFCLLGMTSLLVASLCWTAGETALVPLHDPRLSESLAFKNP